jgi:hypothetical protein
VPGLVDQHHQRQLGRQLLHPLQGDVGEAHHPDRGVLAGPPERRQQLRETPLDQPAVPGGVLGLDRQLDPSIRLGDGLEETSQGEHLGEIGRLVVEDRPRVLPRGELELVEIGELHRRDQAVGTRRTAQVAVVHADQVSVGGEPHIAFECVRALADRLQVRRQGVLRLLEARAAMSDDLRPHDDNSDLSRRLRKGNRREPRRCSRTLPRRVTLHHR